MFLTKEEAQFIKMTETRIPKLITLLAIPTVIAMLVTALYNFADTAFVASLNNDSITAAVNVVFPLMTMIQAVGFMVGMGAGSIIARLLGKHLDTEASKTASNALFLTVLFGIVILIFGLIFIKPLMILLNASDTVLPYARDYAFYIIIASPIVMASFALNNFLRAEGKAKLSTIGLTTGAILNVILDPLFIFVFKLGIAGAAIATAISQSVSFIILLSFYLRKKTVVELHIKNISFNFRDFGLICVIGLPSLLRQGLASVATILLNGAANTYGGDTGTAAMGVVAKITQVIFMIMLGIGQGYQPVVGYNYGARKYKRVKESFWFMLIMSTCIMVIGSALFAIFAEPLVDLLVEKEEGTAIGVNALRFQCLGLAFCALGVACNMSFQSLGKKVRAILVSILRQGICYIPFIIILPIYMGITGVEISMMIADILTFIICIPFAISFFKEINKRIALENEEIKEETIV